MTVGKRIEPADSTLEKVSKGDATCLSPLSVFEKYALTWDEKEQLPVILLRAICRLAEDNPDAIERGFTSRDIVEKVGQIRGFSWETTTEPESKKISRYWKKLQTIQETKKEGIIHQMAAIGLEKYAVVDMVNKGGGTGNETRYSIVWHKFDEEPDIAQILGHPSINSDELPKGWIRYVCEDVEGISKYLTKGWRVQLMISIVLLALIFIVYYGAFLVTLIFDRENTNLMLQLITGGTVFIALVWMFFGHLFKIQTRRIIPMPSIFQSVDNNHLLELKKAKDQSKQIKLVKYSGECPICGGRVIAKSGGLTFYGRIVGKCENAPVEHIFSFDHVTRRGKPLR